jgi:type III secretion protein V
VSAKETTLLESRRSAELGLAAAVVLTVTVMIVPLPTWLLDVLLATNLTLAALLLLVALFVRDALSFGSFPTLLLVTTLFRLGLNVSSTRLILAQADAGAVIRAFGELVVGGDAIVGAVVFAVLALIQLLVIARGAERVAEVGARFVLDAMPGKQLAIDADLRAGALDAAAAGERRRELEREGQLYGAMDGAMKFVKGDAIAGVVIVLVNLVGGLAIGVLARGMDAREALRTYGLLSIGDGLVCQIPSLLISTAAGLVVTRVASRQEDGSLGADVAAQVFGDRRALLAAAVLAALLGLVPGLPLTPFATIAALLALVAYGLRRREARRAAEAGPATPPLGRALELRVGVELARRLASDHAFSHGVARAAAALYEHLGVRLPSVEPHASSALAGDAYLLLRAAVPVREGRCPAGRVFVRGPAEELTMLDDGVELERDGGWIDAKRAANRAGAATAPLVTSATAELLVEAIREAALERPEQLLGLDETQRELDALAHEAPVLVREVVPDRVSLARLTALLRALLSERVSIRPLREILEALATDPLPATHAALVEVIRVRLAPALTHAFASADGTLRFFGVDPFVEETLRKAPRDDLGPVLAPDLARDLRAAVARAVEGAGRTPVLLTQPDIRAALRAALLPELAHVVVLSYRELDPSARVERLGVITA